MYFLYCSILAAQIFQRAKLNWFGSPRPNGGYENTCTVMTIISVVVLVLTSALSTMALVIDGYNLVTPSGFEIASVAISNCFLIYMLISITRVRNLFRRRYEIPGTCCCDGCIDDLCCIYFCSCCSIIQMHRHTHDEHRYSYDIFSETGLTSDAPELMIV